MPVWILLSLLYPTLLGIVSTVDKIVVDRYVRSVYFYYFWIGVYELVLGLLFLGVAISFEIEESEGILGGLITGGLRGLGVILLISAIKRGQVARVIPIWFLYPLMVAPMAVLFLDESLPALAWSAVPLAVMGAMLVSWQGTGGLSRFGDPLTVLLAVCGALLFAGSLALSKHFVTDETFWQFYGSSRVGHGIAMLVFSLLAVDVRRSALKEAGNRPFMGCVVLGEFVITGSNLAALGAVILGPVSLVAAIGAMQPISVFVFSVALATLFPASFGHWITRTALRPQAAGIAAITGAVVLITMSGAE